MWSGFVLKLKWGSYIPVHDDPMGKNCFDFHTIGLGGTYFQTHPIANCQQLGSLVNKNHAMNDIEAWI